MVVRRPERRDRARGTDHVTRAGTIVGGLAAVLIVGFVLRAGLPNDRPMLPGLTVGVENATPEQVTALAAAALEEPLHEMNGETPTSSPRSKTASVGP